MQLGSMHWEVTFMFKCHPIKNIENGQQTEVGLGQFLKVACLGWFWADFPIWKFKITTTRKKDEFIPIFQFPVFLRLHTDWKSDKSNSCAFPISVFETGCDDAGGGAFESICTKLTPRPVVGKERRAVLLLQHSTTITITKQQNSTKITITKQQHPAPVAHQSGLRAVLTISGNIISEINITAILYQQTKQNYISTKRF